MSMGVFIMNVHTTYALILLLSSTPGPVMSQYPLCTERSTWLTMGMYPNNDAVDTCRDACRANSSLTFFNVRRQGPYADLAECHCSGTRPETSVINCFYSCGGFPCGGDGGTHSVYPVCPEHGYGNWCKYSCPGVCIDGVCQRDSGECAAGCLSGYHGDLCNKTCGNCASGTCRQSDAACEGYCVDGWYTPQCTAPCSEHCEGPTKTCEQNAGECTEGCETGWFTPQCTAPCSEHCGGPTKTCEQNAGECIEGCQAGWYTPQCTVPCPGYCKLTSCTLESGHCEDGCKDGYFGVSCDDSCPTNCSEAGCTQDSGLCYSCRSEYFGELCGEVCPKNCADGVCEMTSGSCTEGCEPGWCGVHCNTVITTNVLSTPAWIGICVTLVAIIVGSVITNILLVRKNKRTSKDSRDGTGNPGIHVSSRHNMVDRGCQTSGWHADYLAMSGVPDVNDETTVTVPQYRHLKHDGIANALYSSYEELASVDKAHNVHGVIYEEIANNQELTQRGITLPDTYDTIEGAS